MKNYSILLTLALCASSSVYAQSNLACPASVKAGNPLTVNATFTNDNPGKAFTITHTIVSLVGNAGGAFGLQGPFVNAYSGTIPAATIQYVNVPTGDPFCGTGPNQDGSPCTYQGINIIPGTVTISNLPVINKAPAGMAGSLIAVTAGVMDSTNSTAATTPNENNQVKMSGSCAVYVTH